MRISHARTTRGVVPKGTRPALLPAWKTATILKRANAQPGRVAEGTLDISPLQSRVMLMARTATGRW